MRAKFLETEKTSSLDTRLHRPPVAYFLVTDIMSVWYISSRERSFTRLARGLVLTRSMTRITRLGMTTSRNTGAGVYAEVPRFCALGDHHFDGSARSSRLDRENVSLPYPIDQKLPLHTTKV